LEKKQSINIIIFLLTDIFIGMIKKILREYLNKKSNSVKELLIDRVPFLKDYNIFDNPRYPEDLTSQKITYNENVKFFTKDRETILFSQFNVSSEIFYYPHKINENTFHYFIVKNEFFITKPEGMDDLTFRVLLMMFKHVEENLSYRGEIMVKENETIPEDELDRIINKMNESLFKLEEFCDKHYIDFF
jgi:hypothetical protein